MSKTLPRWTGHRHRAVRQMASFMLGFVLLQSPLGVQAQYAGGSGRGEAFVQIQGTPASSAIFIGGSGRGEVGTTIQTAPLTSAIFLGGSGRGESFVELQGTPVASSIYAGGIGRGEGIFQIDLPLNLAIALRGKLEGPYDASTGLMNDALRALAAFPLTEPYTILGYVHAGGGGGESLSPAVLTVSGNNAIVDWVVVELRDATTPTTVLSSRCALVQRDGDVVATDGSSPVIFTQPLGSYHVALRHRNHLGIMTGFPVTLSTTATSLDLSIPGGVLYGTNAFKFITGTFPAQVLWAGDVTFNGQVKYTGSGNDRDPILTTVGSTTPNNTVVNTYSTRDVNLNGQVKYTGSGNDRDPILVNVGSTTPNNVRLQQLP